MPLFSYQCESCGAESELLVSSAAGAPACPSCGADALKKLASAFARPRAETAAPTGPCCDGCPSSGGACPYQE